MKIDLHCHTKQIKEGDGPGRNVSPEQFRQKIIDANVKIVAITNHNAFDYDQYVLLKGVVAGECAVWPGVEIDILGRNRGKYHLIIVANPENAENFAQGVSKLFKGKNLETCKLPLRTVYDALHQNDVIYIPHYYKKPGISEEDRCELLELVGDASRVFGEAQDHRTLGVLSNHDFSMLIGSDVKDWNHYEKCTFADIRLPVTSFTQFCLLAKRDNIVVETLLNQKSAYEITASPYKGVKLPLKLFAEVNIIFGQKGTGKSEILKSLYTGMLERGVSCEWYAGSDRDDDFSSLLSNADMDRDLNKIGADSCAAEFTTIFKWSDHPPTLLANYFEWWKTKDNSANKSLMKITEAASVGNPPISNIEKHTRDFANIKSAAVSLGKIDIAQYLSPEDVCALQSLLHGLQNAIRDSLQKDVVAKYSNQLTDFTIERIKMHADKNSDTVSKPSSPGFREFAAGRLRLRKTLATILENLQKPEHNEKTTLGELEGKGTIFINKRYRMHDSSSRTAEFEGRISDLRKIRDHLDKMYSEVFTSKLAAHIDDFTRSCTDANITSLKSFLGTSKQVVLESGCEYKPSNGEKGILLLQQVLNKEADAYFLDEPELGMGNSYIDTNIRPIITELGKRHKVVVIATHNANIAVRTLPYTSIFRVHENGVYTTYTGNPFNDQLVNIENKDDVRSWSFESMHTLEGGEEAFYERKAIYESKSN